MILFLFIKFFLFGDSPSADTRAAVRAAARRQRTLSHSNSLRKKRSSAALGARHVPAVGSAANNAALTTDKILEKTYYNVDGHQPESLDWFNVLIAQTIAQLRADALDDDAVLTSLTRILNGPQKPDFLSEIKVTEISLGEEFPILSNCRIIPVDEDGSVVRPTANAGRRGFANALRDSRLEARMDVDLSDVVTLGIETKLVLNYPKPFVAVLPVALSVSVVRFSGTLSLSFTPSQAPGPSDPSSSPPTTEPGHLPTTLTFTFLDDYRLDLSVHSLIGSRSRLQDVPKIAQLLEQRLHQWFDERCVEPRFQQIILPSLWPRKKNARGPESIPPEDEEGLEHAVDEAELLPPRPGTASSENTDGRTTGTAPRGPRQMPHQRRKEQRTTQQGGGLGLDGGELDEAGAEIRAAEARSRIREMRRALDDD